MRRSEPREALHRRSDDWWDGYNERVARLEETLRSRPRDHWPSQTEMHRYLLDLPPVASEPPPKPEPPRTKAQLIWPYLK
jgi:hypothetical protein